MKKTLLLMLIPAVCLMADVKQSKTTTVEFAGTFGKMMKLFGGGKPQTQVDYYTASAQRTDTYSNGKLETSQIIDLDKELFLTIDHKKKEYSQMTFEEWRQMMREVLTSMAEGKEDKRAEGEVKWNFTVDVKETGEKEQIAGRPTDKVVITLKVEAEVTTQEEGKIPETERSTLWVTSTEWLHRGGGQEQKEMQNFHQALGKKLGIMPDEASMRKLVQQVFAAYPQMSQAMERLQKESAKLAGFPMRLNTLYESEPDQAAAQRAKEEKKKDESPQVPTSVEGLAGALGKKMLSKQLEKKQETTGSRTKLMTSFEEVTELTSEPLESSLFQVPAGYKLVKNEQR